MPKSYWLLGIVGLGLGIGWPTGDTEVSRVVFIRCWQGSCTLVQHAGRSILIDCGPRNEFVDAGERLIAPELYRLGVQRLDLVILTHPDSDHVGGLVSLARRFPVGKVVISDLFRGHSDMRAWLNQARIPTSRVSWISPSREWGWAGWKCRVSRPKFFQPQTDNDGSLLIRVEGPAQSVTITGDASFEAEAAMVAEGLAAKSDVLVAGHHGSRTSTGDPILASVGPSDVVISVGRNNSYGHPNRDTLQRIQNSGAKVWRTDRDGTLEFRPVATGGWRVIR